MTEEELNNLRMEAEAARLKREISGGEKPLKGNRVIYILLWFFFGFFGIHNFYVGRMGVGILELILTITGIGALVTCILLLFDLFLLGSDRVYWE